MHADAIWTRSVLLGRYDFPAAENIPRENMHTRVHSAPRRCFFLRKSREQWPLYNAFYLARIRTSADTFVSRIYTFPFLFALKNTRVEYATWKRRKKTSAVDNIC